MFQAKLPARKFKGYVCTGTQAMHAVSDEKGMEGGVGERVELEDVQGSRVGGVEGKGRGDEKVV